jgi:hypothetical protein
LRLLLLLAENWQSSLQQLQQQEYAVEQCKD